MVIRNITVNVGQSEQQGLLENAIFQLNLAAVPSLLLDLPAIEYPTNSDTAHILWNSPFIDSSYESIFSHGLHSYEHIWRALANR